MLLTTVFFSRRCYLNYDRFMVCTAALFLASKIFNERKKIDYFYLNYHNMRNKMVGLVAPPPLLDAERTRLEQRLCAAECLLLKTV